MVQLSDTAIEIMYSYLLLVSFFGVFVALTGQSIFGSAFPTSPFTTTTFAYVNTCAEGDWVCQLVNNLSQVVALLNIPFQVLGYLWAIFIFFMTSPVYFWLGAIFIPAGLIALILLLPIITRIIELINQILNAIANAIPF